MLKNKLNYKLINLTALMLFLYIGFSNIGLWLNVLSTVAKLLMPFLIAFVFAYALYPIVRILEKKNIKHTLAVTIVVISVALVLIALISATLPVVYEQLTSLSKIALDLISNIGDKFNLNVAGMEIKVEDFIDTSIENIGGIISNGAIDVIGQSVGFIGTFIVGFIAWIYFLADMQKIRAFCSTNLRTLKNRSYEYFKCLDKEIGNYIRGLGIFMIIQLFEYSLVFFLVGHPNWLLLGLLASVTTVIPYFGGLITNIIAVITGSVISTKVFIGTIIICLIFPQLDGYFISPKVYGKTNNINPLITIMVVSIGGTLAGIIGIIAALPVYLLIRTTYHFFAPDIKKVSQKLKEE